MKVAPYRILRKNQEELQIYGPEGQGDLRTISSYPSKVNATQTPDPCLFERVYTEHGSYQGMILFIRD